MSEKQTAALKLQSFEESEEDVVAIDVGYGYVKAASTYGKHLIFPSVVATAWDLPLADMAGDMAGYRVKIQKEDGQEENWFVGELALKEGQELRYTMDRVKHNHPSHDVLLLTAAALARPTWQRYPAPVETDNSGPTLVVGLPVDCYKDRAHKKSLMEHLENLKASVTVNNHNPVWVTFSGGKVIVYPQGAGALLTARDMPDEGVVALVDVGHKTTDCVSVEFENGIQKLVHSMCHSVDYGVRALIEAVSEEFFKETKTQLPYNKAMEVLKKGYMWYKGEKVNMTQAISQARTKVAKAIADQVLAKWGSRADFVRKIYLAGGGAEELPALETIFPAPATKINDAQWANVLGFLEAVKKRTGNTRVTQERQG